MESLGKSLSDPLFITSPKSFLQSLRIEYEDEPILSGINLILTFAKTTKFEAVCIDSRARYA